MKDSEIEHLIEKFESGQISQDEMMQMEALIESGTIPLSSVPSLHALSEKVAALDDPNPSPLIERKVYRMIAEGTNAKPWWQGSIVKFAAASVVLLIGFASGMLLNRPNSDARQIDALSQQVTDLKEMVMLALLEKESATERLRAVSLTQDMDQASKKVVSALIETLNQDPNVNVRLAALDALLAYGDRPEVREALVRSIAQQESPLVQAGLAEAMARLQIKSSVKELQKIVEDEKTPEEVKKLINKTIGKMI